MSPFKFKRAARLTACLALLATFVEGEVSPVSAQDSIVKSAKPLALDARTEPRDVSETGKREKTSSKPETNETQKTRKNNAASHFSSVGQREHGEESTVVRLADPILLSPFDSKWSDEEIRFYLETSPVRATSMLQPTPFLEPQITVSADDPPASDSFAAASLTAASSRLATRRRLGADRSVRRFQADSVLGAESSPLSTTDLGNLLKKSKTSLSTRVQKRNPVVNDPRIRGSRIGSLAASGSHWVPARADLDTVLSKVDSRLIENVIVTPGPYTASLGPGFHFVDFQLKTSPRSTSGIERGGLSALNFNSNGDQLLAQQSLTYGTETWGARGSYVHRTGNDYRAGDGQTIAGDFESREFFLGYGRDIGSSYTAEFSLLRLDQTDVDFPGYVFDLDVLVTDGYGIKLTNADPSIGELVETDVWYNRTRFNGNAQNPQKRAQFPSLDDISYVGFTDVDSLSTGYRRSRFWGTDRDAWRLAIGHDLRFIKQELNEISSSIGFPFNFTNVNSPIPRSFSANPGMFVEYEETLQDTVTVRAGGRLDYVGTDVVDDPTKLQDIGSHFPPQSYDQIVGTSQKQTDRMLGSVYSTLSHDYENGAVASLSFGFAQRAPTLTELYAAEPYLLLLQNGLNIVTGDPRLKKESVIQCDAAIEKRADTYRWGARAFHSWALDYITLENTGVVTDFNGNVNQVDLRYVNTELATFTGIELFGELMPQSCISPFLNLKYVDGRDRTRNGDFATRSATGFNDSQRIAGLPRGSFSGVGGANSEPLPGISPFEANLGLRITDPSAKRQWNLDFNARIVDNQDRVATSLLESPTPGFTVYDVRGNFRPQRFPNMLLVAGVENLTDKTYQEHLDFRPQVGVPVLQAGFNFYVGTDISY